MYVCTLNWSLAQDAILCPAALATEPNAPGYIPGKDGWIFGEWDLRTDFGISEDAKPFIARMAKALESKGIKLVAVSIPSRGIIHADRVDYSQALAANFSQEIALQNYLSSLKEYESLGIMTVNPLDYLNDNSDTLDFKLDMHWTPQGARQIAKAVGATLSNLPEFQTLPKNTFTVTETVTTDYAGTYSDDVAELCGSPLPKEPLQRYDLTSDASVGLLDSTEPDIVLLGTSFSNGQFSFDSFLKESTGVDVLPISINGGSRWYSLEQLFIDSNTPLPKIILWEFPAKVVEGWETTFIRRVTPMIYGACTPENSLAKQDATLVASQENIILQSSEGIPIQGANSFVAIDIPDLSVVNFLLNFTYQDGSQEAVRVNRDLRVENSGQFLVELTDGATALTQVTLSDSTYAGLIATRVCQIPN
jgi:alginate biosynthesis protein AlgX